VILSRRRIIRGKEIKMTVAAAKTILVVDDEADVRNFLKIALLEAGFNVITAKNGNEALK